MNIHTDVRAGALSSSALPSVPTMSEVHAAIPDHCFERRLSTSLRHAVTSLVLTVGTMVLAALFLPLTWALAPVWIAYAAVAGTLATGVWVIAHECGHGAFADQKRTQDAVGFVLHSALLVPYFSWQRSHAIHHAKTNHVVDGETWVPARSDEPTTHSRLQAVWSIFSKLVLGWPVYLVTGSTGGEQRGTTNHFWPFRPFSQALFPARLRRRVLTSASGVLAMVGGLVAWAVIAGNPMLVIAVYVGPYLVCNMWLVGYTLLQHTDHDVPHYDEPDWSYVRGAFCSIDRPYGKVFDFVHHRIGSTHVAHHLVSRIPHYHAREATEALAATFPDLYRHDPTPVPRALWRVARRCATVTRTADGWRFAPLPTD